ncbi:MAG: DoxX family membrane protein [Cellulophaga sp.]
MNSKVILGLRVVFGLALLFFGANKLFGFMDPPPPPENAIGYWTALGVSKTMMLVAIVEIAAGLSLLINKYAALMMLILMSVSVNAVLYHATLDSAGLPMGAVLLLLNIVMLVAYKDKYANLLKG